MPTQEQPSIFYGSFDRFPCSQGRPETHHTTEELQLLILNASISQILNEKHLLCLAQTAIYKYFFS